MQLRRKSNGRPAFFLTVFWINTRPAFCLSYYLSFPISSIFFLWTRLFVIIWQQGNHSVLCFYKKFLKSFILRPIRSSVQKMRQPKLTHKKHRAPICYHTNFDNSHGDAKKEACIFYKMRLRENTCHIQFVWCLYFITKDNYCQYINKLFWNSETTQNFIAVIDPFLDLTVPWNRSYNAGFGALLIIIKKPDYSFI